MKKIVAILAILAAFGLLLASCAAGGAASGMKVGMVTDAGTIDDKSFNQGTWEGILKAGTELKVETKYLKPTGTVEADYVKEIGNLYDAGFKFIVTPGYKFETSVLVVQDKYADAKFVLIDGVPNNGAFDATRIEKVGPNTVSILFAEHESGFLAAVAAAVQVKEGAFGFIGGMAIPAVQKFNWGFQQGVAYANANLGTKITIKPEFIIYSGSFSDIPLGTQLAAQLYDKGVKAIFAAAGTVGVGVINEAKTRAASGVWAIGVDKDQYSEGIYEGEKSVVLTSAMKRVDQAAYDMIKAELDKQFPGGQTLTFNAKNNGIGIPAVNPNLSEEATKAAADVFAKLQAGEITVSAEQGDLIK